MDSKISGNQYKAEIRDIKIKKHYKKLIRNNLIRKFSTTEEILSDKDNLTPEDVDKINKALYNIFSENRYMIGNHNATIMLNIMKNDYKNCGFEQYFQWREKIEYKNQRKISGYDRYML